MELAFTLNKDLKNLPSTFSPEEAIDSIEGYALTIDMTARNVQDEAKKKGLPWSIGKGFDTFCQCLNSSPRKKSQTHTKVELVLKINGEVKQQDKTDLMLFPIHKILSHMSAIMTLEKET